MIVTNRELLELIHEYANWAFCQGFIAAKENINELEYHTMPQAKKRIQKFAEIYKMLTLCKQH